MGVFDQKFVIEFFITFNRRTVKDVKVLPGNSLLLLVEIEIRVENLKVKEKEE